MNYSVFEKIRKKYKKENALKEFEKFLEEQMMENITENKNSLLYNEKMTAKRLNISYSNLKLIRQRGEISHVRIGRRIFYRLLDIENFISKRAVAV